MSTSPVGFVELLQFFLPKIFFSVLCGGLVGLERELKDKPAGIKTNILICFGATLFTSISVLLANLQAEAGHYGDPGRVAAQIVSGIGFIGGGAIIQARGTILGLTTAATMWVVAAIGVCIGTGYWEVGLICSGSVVLVLILSNTFEDRVLGRSLNFACDVVVEDPEGRIRSAINELLHKNDLELIDFDMAERGEFSLLSLKYRGHRNHHKKFVLALWAHPGIREVHQN